MKHVFLAIALSSALMVAPVAASPQKDLPKTQDAFVLETVGVIVVNIALIGYGIWIGYSAHENAISDTMARKCELNTGKTKLICKMGKKDISVFERWKRELKAKLLLEEVAKLEATE